MVGSKGVTIMKRVRQYVVRTLVAALATTQLTITSGCATLAHRSSLSGGLVRTTAQCDGTDSTCPWLWGDAAWLLAGVVPGLVGFAVDFGSGACKHDNLGDKTARTIDEDTDEFASKR